MPVLFLILLILAAIGSALFKKWLFKVAREERRDYYQNVYLKSEAWQRKRYVVLKRDNWRCVYCGAKATEVHHKRYAKYNIGKEPIKWLVSICRACHNEKHQ
jgi:5-methylcytosine-specific restriction endonuclease McrA